MYGWMGCKMDKYKNMSLIDPPPPPSSPAWCHSVACTSSCYHHICSVNFAAVRFEVCMLSIGRKWERKIKARDSSFNSLQKLNFVTIEDFILKWVFDGKKDNQIKYDHLQFKKNKYDKSITIEPVEKSYNFTYDKRKIIINTDNKTIIDTLPFSNKR